MLHQSAAPLPSYLPPDPALPSPSRLAYPGRPRDSQGGTFAVPVNVRRPRSAAAKSPHPALDSDDPNLNTVYPFVGGPSTNPDTQRPQSAFERREIRLERQEEEERYARTRAFGKIVVERPDPYNRKVIKDNHCTPNVRSWYW